MLPTDVCCCLPRSRKDTDIAAVSAGASHSGVEELVKRYESDQHDASMAFDSDTFTVETSGHPGVSLHAMKHTPQLC